MTKEPFYITTPIYYVNDRPHIGHAYTSVACDVLARFMRLHGREVKFLTGTDEHGQKVEKSAEKAGVSPKAFVDEVSVHFRELTKTMNISNDDFIRTTEERHIKSAQGLWKKMLDNGHIYLGSYAGWYAVRDEAFYTDSDIKQVVKLGDITAAGATHSFPDGAANYVGTAVRDALPTDNEANKFWISKETGAQVEWVEEPSYFFKLSAFGDKLLEHFEKYPEFIMPASRRNEVVSFVKGGLRDLSISRTTFTWGIPVPGDEQHIMYVWLDALANYISAIGYPDENAAEYKKFWPGDIHMVGKDILRFHTVYWPAFLMAAELPVVKRVFAHGWWTIEGEKMSKSLGNAVAPEELVNQYGLDQTRWFLMREVPFGNDGNFSRDRMIAVINSELANNLGNLVQRTLSMVHKNCGGVVPDAHGVAKDELDLSFLAKAQVTDAATPEKVAAMYYDCRFNEILGDILAISGEANQYIDTKAPWKQKKEDPKLMEATLYHLLEGIRCIAIMVQPVMPEIAAKILVMLGYDEARAKQGVAFTELKPEFAIKPGVALGQPQPLFPRIEEKKG